MLYTITSCTILDIDVFDHGNICGNIILMYFILGDAIDCNSQSAKGRCAMQNDDDIRELMQLRAEVETMLSKIGNILARRIAFAQAQVQAQAQTPVATQYMPLPPAQVQQPVAPPQYAAPQYQPQPAFQQPVMQVPYQMPVQQAYAPPPVMSMPMPAAPAPAAPKPQPPAPVRLPVAQPMPAAGSSLPADLPSVVAAMIQIMRNQAKLMTFEQIYERLQAEKVAMPADKPMLIIRRHLFNKAYFSAEKDRYWPAMDPHP